MRTLHFIYTVPRGTLFDRALNKITSVAGFPPPYRDGNFIPWKHPIRAPHSISYHLLKALKQKYRVKFYNMYEHGVCDTKPGDIVLAQPAPVLPHAPPKEMDKDAITYRTFSEKAGITKIIIMPYSHDASYAAWWAELVRNYGANCIFITGKRWFDTWEESPYKSFPIKEKLRLNVGLNIYDYLPVKMKYNPEGKRGVFYIGHTGWYKNVPMLEALAKALPDVRFGHVGAGKLQGWEQIADFADLTPAFVSELGTKYDLLINVSTGDPQVTTVLEMTASGFPVACTPESGHSLPSAIPLKVDDLAYNVERIKEFQALSSDAIKKMVSENRAYVAKEHDWKKISDDVLGFIERVSA